MTREVKGWHVLVMLLVFFGITIGVNSVFVSYALSTFAGEDVEQPYMKGLEYNKTIAARVAQQKLGWTATLAAGRNDAKEVAVELHVEGHDKLAVNGLDVTVMLRHPTNAHFDREVKLDPQGNGVYRATLTHVLPGQWDVIADARMNGQLSFEAKRRIVLP
ncbi:MAG: FixH family protein [Micropepsaceae bacterium]